MDDDVTWNNPLDLQSILNSRCSNIEDEGAELLHVTVERDLGTSKKTWKEQLHLSLEEVIKTEAA
jgi:hypothetical protein